MRSYTAAARLAVVTASLVLLVGCTTGATPSPSPTPMSAAVSPSATSSPLGAPSAATASPSATPQPSPKPTPVPVPPKPTGVEFDEQVRVSDDEAVAEITQTVTWRAPLSEGVEIRVYGVTECIAEPADPEPGTSGPCLVVHTPLPESVRTLLATAPASDGTVSWAWTEETGCNPGLANDPAGPPYFSVVLAAYGPSGHSIFAIAESGQWWRPAPGDVVC